MCCKKDCENCEKKCPCKKMFKDGKLTKTGWVVIGALIGCLVYFHKKRASKKSRD